MNEPIDLDGEAILVDDRWQKKDDLAAAIKQKLDKGDFAVAGLSAALERLHQAVSRARVVAFRLEAEASDALTAMAQRQGITVGALLRQSVGATLAGQPPQATTEPAAPEDHANAVPLRPKTGGNARIDESLAERQFFQKGS
jgi:imidazolonepropionase-like amidohydrolase